MGVLLLGAHLMAQQPAAPHETGSQPANGSADAAPPLHPITLAQTKEMFELMHFQSTMQQILHTTIARQREAAPFVPEDVWQDFESSFGKVDFIEVFLPIYQKYLSQEDAAKALEFYRTPAGQHTLTVMAPLMQDVSQASQHKGEEIARQVFDRHRQEIEDAARKSGQPVGPPSTATPGSQPPQ